MPKVVITMPAYRAQHTLAKTVADIPVGVADEIIVVDDASPDHTVEVARALGIRVVVHPQNRGYGGNQKTCYREALEADADIVVLLHPDYQYDPKAVPLLIAPILAGDADMTFGSRFAGLGNPLAGGMPLYRFLGNRVTTTAANILLGSRFTDLHSGMRAYTRSCLLTVPFLGYSDDFAFDSAFLADAVTLGQRVVEVPIPTRYSKESSSISVPASLRYVAHSMWEHTRASVRRGRRGERSPATFGPVLRRGPELGRGPSVAHPCAMCGSDQATLVYPANVTGEVPIEEFACSTGALARHDDIVQCGRCGLVSSIPTLSESEILGRYQQVADEEYIAQEQARIEVFEWFVQAAASYPVRGSRLLEIGANVGLFLHVASRSGWEASGIEPSEWAVRTGRERYGVNLLPGTIESMEAKPGSADAIVMMDVLEHLNDPLAALRKLRPVLDDEGLLVLSTVNLSGLHARLRKGSWPWFIRSHLHYFSPQTLTAMLHLAGFRTIEWATVPRSFHLSYLAHRAGSSHALLGGAARAAASVADVRVPMGWLQDIALVAARPAPPAPQQAR